MKTSDQVYRGSITKVGLLLWFIVFSIPILGNAITSDVKPHSDHRSRTTSSISVSGKSTSSASNSADATVAKGSDQKQGGTPFVTLAVSDRIAFWAMVAGVITAFATIAQACVAYLIARSIGKASSQSEALQISREIDRIWQDFNHQAIVNEEFRNTIRRLESLSEDSQTTQLRHLIFYLLNIIYISWTAQKSKRDEFEHSKTIVKDHLAILYSKKDLVLGILNGNRGYNKVFVQDCTQAFAQLDKERVTVNDESGQPRGPRNGEVQNDSRGSSEQSSPAAHQQEFQGEQASRSDHETENHHRPDADVEVFSQMTESEQVSNDCGGTEVRSLQNKPNKSNVSVEKDSQLKEGITDMQLEDTSSLQIRLARPDEWQVLQALNLQIFEFELETCEPTSNLEYPFSPSGEQYFKKAASQEDDFAAIVAEISEAIVGYAIVKRISPIDLGHRVGVIQYQLHTLSVDKLHRNRGIGSELVDAAKAFAKERGANRIKVTAYAPNKRAEHVYKKKGFSELEITYETVL